MAENDAAQATQDRTPDTGSQKRSGIESAAYSEVNQARSDQSNFWSNQM